MLNIARQEFCTILYTSDSFNMDDEKVANPNAGFVENARRGSRRGSNADPDSLAKAFENPLSSRSKEELISDVDEFCRKFGLMDFIDTSARVFYSPGEGPVPFTYSAEAFPVHVRDVGMSWATTTTWCFNFIISFTWPSLRTAFTVQGAFGWYAGWCVILWFLILLFVPETKALTLEELDQVFSVSTRKHASYQIHNAIWHFKTWVLRQKLEPMTPFYTAAEKMSED